MLTNMSSPFNGDTFIQEEFLRLRDKYSLTTAVETGTNLGDTTVWLARNFQKTVSCEIDQQLFDHCSKRFLEEKVHIQLFRESSEKLLDYAIPHQGIGHDTIFFLDAHWNSYCPLLDELEVIAKYELLPVIAIHDFKVPEGGLGYDGYNGQDYTFEWIKPKIDKIYSFKSRGYKHYYNTSEKACGAMRGIIYIVPA